MARGAQLLAWTLAAAQGYEALSEGRLPRDCPGAAAASRGSRGRSCCQSGSQYDRRRGCRLPTSPTCTPHPLPAKRKPQLSVLTLGQPALQDPNWVVRAAPVAPDECHPTEARIRARAESRGDIQLLPPGTPLFPGPVPNALPEISHLILAISQ